MAGAQVDTFYGASILFGTSGFSYNIVGVNIGSLETPALETSHIATTQAGVGQEGNATYIPGDIVRHGPMTLRIHWNPSLGVIPIAVVQTITITYPLVTGDLTAAYQTGTGFVSGFTPDEFVIDGVMTALVTVQKSAPWTKVAAT